MMLFFISYIIVDIDDTLSNVAKILRVASINGVPVLEKGTLVGVVSRYGINNSIQNRISVKSVISVR